MRNLLALIGLLVVAFAAIGWYCEWYKRSVSRGSEGQPEIKTTVNTNKVTEDSSAFFKRMEQLVTERARTEEQKNAQPLVTPGNTPGPIAPVKGGTTNLPSMNLPPPLPPVKGGIPSTIKGPQ